jgi:hypothetical protein
MQQLRMREEARESRTQWTSLSSAREPRKTHEQETKLNLEKMREALAVTLKGCRPITDILN